MIYDMESKIYVMALDNFAIWLRYCKFWAWEFRQHPRPLKHQCWWNITAMPPACEHPGLLCTTAPHAGAAPGQGDKEQCVCVYVAACATLGWTPSSRPSWQIPRTSHCCYSVGPTCRWVWLCRPVHTCHWSCPEGIWIWSRVREYCLALCNP